MGKGKKKKNEVTTVSFGEYIELCGEKETPLYKEINNGENIKIIDYSKVPVAPKSNYEINIKKNILSSGPPYPLTIKNLPMDCTDEKLMSIFNTNVKIEKSNDDGFRNGAIILFDDIDEFKSALLKDGSKYFGRILSIIQGRVSQNIQFNERSGIDLNNRRNKKSNYGSFSENVIPDNWREAKEQNKGISIKSKMNFGNDKNESIEIPSNWRKNDDESPKKIEFFSSNNRSEKNTHNTKMGNIKHKDYKRDNYEDFDLSILRDPNKKLMTNTPKIDNNSEQT